jgi:nucleoside-diphosphate-sugar epimerase
MSIKRVLITGVYGLIAGAIYNRLASKPGEYELHALARRRLPSDRVPDGRSLDIPDERFTLSDMSDLDQLTKIFSGIDVVIHMAADPSGAGGWDSVLNSNIIGAYNVFEACRLAGVKRIVSASSIQASSGYRTEEPYQSIAQGNYDALPDPLPIVRKDWPTRPMNIYASSKVWGEGLARIYSDIHGLSCLCLRIGWVVAEDRPPNPNSGDVWCSQRDIAQITECCINAPENLRYDIFYGLSDNKYRWVDIEHARETIGYDPQDRAEDHS